MKEKVKALISKKGILILSVVLIFLVIAGSMTYGTYQKALNNISRAEVIEKDAEVDEALLGNLEETTQLLTEETTELTTVPTTLPYTPFEEDVINILVVGQAYREGEENKMSDTILLVSVNKYTKVVHLTSFLRDTYVDMPDYMGHFCGWNRINVVYHLGWLWGDTGGAMEMMNLCLKNNFGINVDYNVEVDFTAFEKVIDVLGGIRLELTENEADYLNSKAEECHWIQTVEPGENRLFGETALEYARMRKATGDGGSDIRRTARQRNLIKAIIAKLTRKGFPAIEELVQEVLPLITTDMTNEEITTCLWEIVPILPELTIKGGTCPVEYWGEVIELGGYQASVLKFDQFQNTRLMQAITEAQHGEPEENP